MKIVKVTGDKKRYLDLLLLADEQEDMIDRYLPDGTMYVLNDGGVKGVCVVMDMGDGVLELKNIAVDAAHQRRGYGRALIDFIAAEYRGSYAVLTVGTGDVPSALRFYEGCGFVRSGVIKNFFTDHYDHPMVEDGVRLKDMVLLSRDLT